MEVATSVELSKQRISSFVVGGGIDGVLVVPLLETEILVAKRSSAVVGKALDGGALGCGLPG